MDASQILPNLLIGSCPVIADDADRLKEGGVTAVLNVQTDDDIANWGIDWPRLEQQYQKAGIEFRRVPVRDFDPEDVRRKLPACVETLDGLLQGGHTVFLHCNIGINRSPTIAIAYLHWQLGWALEKAIDHVMRCRSCDPYLDVIRPNPT